MTTEKLGKEHPGKLLLEFSVPAMIGMIVIAIYNVVDRIFIGNDPLTGAVGLAAVTITYPVVIFLIGVCLLLGVGGATCFSIALGQQNKQLAAEYMGTTFFLAGVMSLLLTCLGQSLIGPLLLFLGASDVVYPLAIDYLTIILYGTLFQVMALLSNNFSRAQGNPNNAMISQLIGALFNILFDYILIIRFGMGMKGAALATVGGLFLSSLWQLVYLTGKRASIPLKLPLLIPKLTLVGEIITTGMPLFLNQLATGLLMFLLNGRLLRYGGDTAISAVGIITSFANLLLMPIFGLVQGQQPIISYNYGFKQTIRVRQTLKYAAVSALLFTCLSFICVQVYALTFVKLFTSNQAVIEISRYGLKIWFAALPIIGVQIIFASYFQAVGRAKIATFLSLSRPVIFLIPLVLGLSQIWGLAGIFYAVPLADILAFTVTVFFLRRDLRQPEL